MLDPWWFWHHPVLILDELLEECLESGDAPTEDEGVDVVGALVRVDRLQVHHVPVGKKRIFDICVNEMGNLLQK